MKKNETNATDVVVVVPKTQTGELLLEKHVRREPTLLWLIVRVVKAVDVKCCYLFVLSADGGASKSTCMTLN